MEKKRKKSHHIYSAATGASRAELEKESNVGLLRPQTRPATVE
jgi:hypothetical protein